VIVIGELQFNFLLIYKFDQLFNIIGIRSKLWVVAGEKLSSDLENPAMGWANSIGHRKSLTSHYACILPVSWVFLIFLPPLHHDWAFDADEPNSSNPKKKKEGVVWGFALARFCCGSIFFSHAEYTNVATFLFLDYDSLVHRRIPPSAPFFCKIFQV